mgnify:CR=1 FL=1
MNLEDCLCVLIPLKGRERETHRIIKYFQKVKLPFKILFADGGDKDLSHDIDRSNLNIEYFYNGPDKSIHDFMRKMRIAFDKIEHPLTIMVDNDDFISVSGMIDGIKYLEEHPDFSSYRENVLSCNSFVPLYKSTSIDNDDLFARIFSAMNNRTVSWHDITRTHYNKILFRILDECNVNDLQMTFSSNMFWSEIYGKSYKGFDKNYYYHVFGNSLVQNRGVFTKYNNWMSDEKFETSFSIILSAASHAIATVHDATILDIKNRLGEFYLTDLAKRNNILVSELNLMKYINKSNQYDDICKSLVEPLHDAPVSFKVTNNYTNEITPDEELSIVRGLV